MKATWLSSGCAAGMSTNYSVGPVACVKPLFFPRINTARSSRRNYQGLTDPMCHMYLSLEKPLGALRDFVIELPHTLINIDELGSPMVDSSGCFRHGGEGGVFSGGILCLSWLCLLGAGRLSN